VKPEANGKVSTKTAGRLCKQRGLSPSLEKRKIYVAVPDLGAEKHGLLRVLDESGDSYLYPKVLFRPIALPQSVAKAVLAAA
jgi:hypothetical protein